MENTVQRTQREVFELKKWLRLILVFSIADLSINLITPNSSAYNWVTWVHYGISAASMYCFFHLMKEHRFYSFTVTCLIIELVMKIASRLATTVFLDDLLKLFPGQELITVISAVTMPLSVIRLIAAFLGYIFELSAHSALVAPFDEKLARNWKQLFFWNLGAGVLTSAVSYLLTYLHQTLSWDYSVYQKIIPLVNLPVTVITIVYMLYLWRTIQKIEVKEEI